MGLIDILFEWNWCADSGVKSVFNVIGTFIDVLRYSVPIILIVMTTLDVTKHVINPEEKDGQQKILYRLIAAVLVFFVPVFVKMAFKVIDWGLNEEDTYADVQSGFDECWR